LEVDRPACRDRLLRNEEIKDDFRAQGSAGVPVERISALTGLSAGEIAGL
jgi:hypothetical protein